MNLIIDIGNTSTKIAIADGKEIRFFQRFSELAITDLMSITSEYKPNGHSIGGWGNSIKSFGLVKAKYSATYCGANTNIPIKTNTPPPKPWASIGWLGQLGQTTFFLIAMY